MKKEIILLIGMVFAILVLFMSLQNNHHGMMRGNSAYFSNYNGLYLTGMNNMDGQMMNSYGRQRYGSGMRFGNYNRLFNHWMHYNY